MTSDGETTRAWGLRTKVEFLKYMGYIEHMRSGVWRRTVRDGIISMNKKAKRSSGGSSSGK